MYGNYGMPGFFLAPMGIIGILVILLLVLGILALIKYLRN